MGTGTIRPPVDDRNAATWDDGGWRFLTTFDGGGVAEIRYLGGPLDGAVEEHSFPPPLGITATTARDPIHAGRMVKADQVESGGTCYRLCELPSGERVYVADGYKL